MLSNAARQSVKNALGRPGLGEEVANAIDQALTDPFGVERARVVKVLTLTDLGAKYVRITTVPAGAILRYVGVTIITTVVAGGTSVKLGIGQQDGTVANYCNTSDLVAGTHKEVLIAGSVLGSDTNIDLSVIVTAANALGNTNISAGKVIVSVVADTPAVLPAT